MHKSVSFPIALLFCVLTSSVAAAQAPPSDGTVLVAPYIGAVLDTPDDWILVGGEARLRLEGLAAEVNPRVTWNPYEGGSMMQLDVNLLHNYPIAGESRFRPYVGVGGAFNRYTVNGFSDSSVGLNLVSGARWVMEPESRFEPFLNAQYTMIRGQANLFTVVVGATIQLR